MYNMAKGCLCKFLKPSTYYLGINTYKEAYKACKRQWNAQELEKIQKKRLHALIEYAYKNVVFYHQQFKSNGIKPEDIKTRDDLSKIPVLKKEDLRMHFPELISTDIHLSKCFLSVTSGSTGDPTAVIRTKKSSIYWDAAILRQRLSYGIRFGERFIYATPDLPGSFIDLLGGFHRVHIFPFFRKNESIDSSSVDINIIKKIRPTVMYGAPSLMVLLAQAAKEEGINDDIFLKAIISSYELLDNGTRKFLEHTFDCDVFDLYGASEGFIAWECPEHTGYHINADNVIVEILRDNEVANEGELGEVTVTYLDNCVMPLIRYKIGDIGSVTEESCPCGRKLPLMKSIEGRSTDMIILPDGRLLSPGVLIRIMTQYTAIGNYQIIQENKNLIVIKYANHLGFTPKRLDEIRESCNRILGENVKVNFVGVDKTDLRKTRKLRCVVSNIQPKF
jgi:phenylacetate-CoA ligase